MASKSTRLDMQQADRQRVPIDWSQAGRLMEAAMSASSAGFTVGTTNWAAHIYRAMLAAAPETPAQASAVDERAAFEAWAKSPPRGQTPLWREGDGYVYWQTEWEAWQARAALAQKGGAA